VRTLVSSSGGKESVIEAIEPPSVFRFCAEYLKSDVRGSGLAAGVDSSCFWWPDPDS